MAHDSVDATRGFPQYAGTGAPADAADLSEISAWAGANVDRIVATQAALAIGYTPIFNGMTIGVTAIQPAVFSYNGATWQMIGTPYFASAGARDSAITSPQEGMSIYRTDVNAEQYYNGSGWVYTQPLVPIRPFVTATGGTAVAGPGGLVTVSGACTAVAIDSAFSSEFDDYKVLVKGTGSATAGALFRLRSAGADIASGYQWGMQDVSFSGTAVASGSASDTSMNFGRINAAGAQFWQEVDITNPNLALGKLFTTRGGATDRARSGGGMYNTGTVCTGFSILCQTGNFQITVRLFGINNVS